MAATLMRCALAAWLLLGAGTTAAQCNFDSLGDATNPFATGCGDVQLSYTENQDGNGRIALGYPVPMPVDSLTAVDGFRRYDSLLAQHQFLAADLDTVTAVRVGATVFGRDIWAYQLGDANLLTVDGQAEPAVLVNGGIHAREWQSPEVLSAILETLAGMHGDDGIGSYLADNLNIVLLPVLNVDGFIQTQAYPDRVTTQENHPREGRMRRKNLRHPTRSAAVDDDIDTIDDNFYGVDLNRNSLHGFGLNSSSSTRDTSLIFRATSPASEPEIQALQAAAALGPADRLRLYVDAHSFTKVYFTPSTGNTRRDAITQALRTRMRAVTGFSYQFTNDPVGATIGTTADYFAVEYEIPAWTLEIEPGSQGGADYGGTGVSHSGFVLPDAEIARVREEMASTHLLGFYRQSGPPRVTAVEIHDATGNVSYAARWTSSQPRRLEVSVNQALLPGSDYRLWVAFDRPMRWRDETGAIANYPGQAVLFPTIALEAPGVLPGDELAIGGDNSDWLDQPGGAPDGYQRYRDDALALDFTLPADTVIAAPAPLVLSIAAQDLSLSALDAFPASAVDWSQGHWSGYQNALGDVGDSGGSDCSYAPFSAPPDQATASAPAATVLCKAAEPPPPPPPAPPPPAPLPVNNGGGGGGGTILWLLVAVSLAQQRARPRARASE